MTSNHTGTGGASLVHLSINDWCEAFGASRATAYRRIKAKTLNTVRLGERMLRIVVRASDLIHIDTGSASPTIGDIRAAIKRSRERMRAHKVASGKSSKRRAACKAACK